MAITLDGTNGILSPDFEPSSSTTPTNGLFLPAANTVGLATGSTERLRIDSSGNLGVGTTSPPSGSRLAISGGSLNFTDTSARDILWGTSSYVYITGNQGTGVLAMGTGSTERARIDSSGNFGIGTSSPGGKLDVSGGYSYLYGLRISGNDTGNTIYQNAAIGISSGNYITFSTNSGGPYERVRIDTSGNLLVGTTSPVLSGQITNTFSAASKNGMVFSETSGTTGATFIYFTANGTAIGNISRVTTTNAVTYNTTSDQRLKENIADAPSALSSINAIKVRSFDWKADGSHVDYGYIAQELLEVAPEAVHAPTDPEEMMGVDFGKLTPRLVKAIQELTARLEALENK